MNPTLNLIRLIVPSVICLWLTSMVQAAGPDTDGAIPGSNNGEGIGVLVNRTSGVWNTGTGYQALNQLTTGGVNTATGLRALFLNTTGFYNTATGVYSLASNVNGEGNTANGWQSLVSNTSGSFNTATGTKALTSNTIGTNNVANGTYALRHNTTGSVNTAIGDDALESNTTGMLNTAVGDAALGGNTTGSLNIALGAQAGLGVTTANNVIAIGYLVPGQNVSNSCYIGNIRDVTPAIPDGIPVVINSAQQLGTMSSSRRFKKEIKPMDSASQSILALKPVTFHYKSDANGTPQFGLIAEEVAEVNPDLVVHDEKGEIYTVRYDAVNAMLLNEFLKEHCKVEEQNRRIQQQEATTAELKQNFGTNIAQQAKQIEALTATVKEQSAQIQKVSDQVELSKPAPKTVLNDR